MSDPATVVNKGADGADNAGKPAPPYPGDVNPTQAKKGTNASDDGKKCGTGAGRGETGIIGLTGTGGQDGGKGEAAAEITWTVDYMTGNYSFQTIGGKGGGAQVGGPGGDGQIGGPGGNGSSHCGSGQQGEGGPGGTGGQGGQGGDGGAAGNIFITYDTAKSIPPPVISASVLPGSGGSSANGGEGGKGGAGDKAGGRGKSGNTPTNPGKGGAGGSIYVNGSPIEKVD
jgi:hypothetical protein